MYEALARGYAIEVQDYNRYPPYQYNLDWLIGIEGDIWVKGLTNFNLESDIRRGEYSRIANLPPIKMIVDVGKLYIVLITRDHTMITIPPSKEVTGVISAFVLRDELLVYSTTNGKLKLIANGLSEGLDKSEEFNNNELIKNIYPMKLGSSLDTILVRYRNEEIQILTLENNQLKNIYHSNHINLLAVHLTSFATPNNITSISVDMSMKSDDISIDGIVDATILSNDVIVRTNNKQVTTPDGRVLMNNVNKFIDILHDISSPIIRGIDEKTYQISDQGITDLNIPFVLA